LKAFPQTDLTHIIIDENNDSENLRTLNCCHFPHLHLMTIRFIECVGLRGKI